MNASVSCYYLGVVEAAVAETRVRHLRAIDCQQPNQSYLSTGKQI